MIPVHADPARSPLTPMVLATGCAEVGPVARQFGLLVQPSRAAIWTMITRPPRATYEILDRGARVVCVAPDETRGDLDWAHLARMPEDVSACREATVAALLETPGPAAPRPLPDTGVRILVHGGRAVVEFAGQASEGDGVAIVRTLPHTLDLFLDLLSACEPMTDRDEQALRLYFVERRTTPRTRQTAFVAAPNAEALSRAITGSARRHHVPARLAEEIVIQEYDAEIAPPAHLATHGMSRLPGGCVWLAGTLDLPLRPRRS